MTSGYPSRSPLIWLQHALRLGKRSWWMTLFVWFLAIAPARAELEMRVAIEQDVNQVKLGSSTNAVIRDGAGRALAELPARGALIATSTGGGVSVGDFQASQIWIEPSQDGFVFIGDKWYRGRTLVTPTGSGLTAVNYVDLEQYLYSVVGAEMPTNWHLEALKAQAVAARSYALYQRQTSANTVFDVGDTQAWQVYGGIEEEAPSTQAAVNATRGQVLTYNGRIIEAVFHSSSGGYTENVEDVWSNPLPYLRAVEDFDQGAPVYQWVASFTAEQLKQRITGIGNIVSITPERTTPRGRIITMRVTGDAGSRVMTGNEVRNALNLRSTLFTVIPQLPPVAATENVPAYPIAFQITGRGFGHGLGMSQWGAYNLAQRGLNYAQIVAHYYTNTRLARIRVE